MAETVDIVRLGARGDGVAEDGTFVSGALPGERVVIERHGDSAHLQEVLSPSTERGLPFCPYFPSCGGCATQHMAAPLYRDWKRAAVVDAVRRAGLSADVAPLVDAAGEGRRRLTLHARRLDGVWQIGYMAARSHAVVPIERCPIAVPALADAAPRLARRLVETLDGRDKPLDIVITASLSGQDVDLRGLGKASERERRALIETTDDLDLARLSLHGEVLVERRPPQLRFGRAMVLPPPGAFLQATAAGETAIAALVREGCEGARRIADLFCGSGPFSLRLAETAQVLAIERDAPALAALARAAHATQGLKTVTTSVRDLFRRPLLPPELAAFDAVVIDPPRAGAEAQARALAASVVPAVVSVSCDAGTFARDAAILAAGGYRLERVVPVDQFVHSAHVEIVGLLRRAPAGRGRPRR